MIDVPINIILSPYQSALTTVVTISSIIIQSTCLYSIYSEPSSITS